MNKLNDVFWSRVSESTNSNVNSVCVYRIIAGLFLLCINFKSVSWIGYTPQAFFQPPVLSIANLFQGFPPPGFFITMDILLIILSVFITAGIKTRISVFIYIIISLTVSNFQYSLGKIDHGVMLSALLFCMSFSGWGRDLAVVPDKIWKIDSVKKSLSLLSVLLCFAFFSAGFEKALAWINFDLNKNGSGSWFYIGYYVLERQRLLAPLFAHLPFWIFKIMDFLAVPFELSPLFFLLTSQKAWRIWILIASAFHIGNTLILNINFIGLAIVYLAFMDYTALFSKIKYLTSLKSVKIAMLFALTLIIFFRIKNSFSYIPVNTSLFNPDSRSNSLYYSIVLWVLIIAFIYKNAFKKTYTRYTRSYKQVI